MLGERAAVDAWRPCPSLAPSTMSEDDGSRSRGASKREATRLFGTPAAPPPERKGATIRIDPDAPPAARAAAVPPPPSSPPSQPGASSPQRTVRIDPTAPAASPASPHARPSLAAPQRTSRTSRSRTTILELSEVAQRMSVLRGSSAGEPSFTQQLALSFAVSATLVLLGTMVLAGGAWRIVLGMLAGITGSTALVWYALRSLPKIAKRLGTRELPGTPTMWLGALVGFALTATAGLTWGVSEATKPLARFGGADFKLPASAEAAEPAAAEPPSELGGRADAKMKRGQHVNLGDGVLYAPPHFASADGQFDLLIHYHGNTELIERSVDAAKLDAIAYIVNFGEMSGRYSEPLRNPHAFDETLERIEQRVGEKLGLERPRIRRVALSSWSAGFGAVYHVLTSRSRLDRIDALLMMDSLHASYAPGSDTKVTDLSVRPFVRFAERAIAGEKLFVLTHSSVETIEYPSTTKSADALLERVGVAREVVDPETASPPPVDIEVALRAFPSKDREWVKVKSVASRGAFTVVAGKGNDKGDHIAHLAQMSVLTLPKLVERWKTPG